jgi:hypothetical protein
MPLQHSKVKMFSLPCVKDNGKLVVARVTTMWLGGLLKAVDILAGPTLRATHQGEVRILVQTSRQVTAVMAGDHGSQKQTEGGVPTKEPWHLRQSALRREQMGNSSTGSNHHEE